MQTNRPPAADRSTRPIDVDRARRHLANRIRYAVAVRDASEARLARLLEELERLDAPAPG